MAYKYLSTENKISLSPKEEMKRHYQQVIDESFKIAVDWFTIEEELLNEKEQYQFVDVRLNSAIANDTGTKLGDDFRKVIFQDITHARGLGFKYRFDDSIWLTINYDIYGKTTASSLVRKCRNVLKWIDTENGSILQEPCVFDNYQLKEASPFYNAQITIPTGFVPIVVQNNKRTRKIKLNQRFYFNGACYKVQSIYNPLNTPTFGDDPIIYMLINIDEINSQRDNIEEGIANAYDYDYKLNIVEENFEQNKGFKTTLHAQVSLNGTDVSRNVLWASSDLKTGSIDEFGNIELLENGTVTFTASLESNALVEDSIVVNIVDTPINKEQTILLPEQRYILQNDSVEFTINKYLNGKQLSDMFDIECTGVPIKHYSLSIINGNKFVINNLLRYPKNPLIVRVTNKITQEQEEYEIVLKGGF